MIACRKERILLMNFLKSMYRNLTKLVVVIFVIAGCFADSDSWWPCYIMYACIAWIALYMFADRKYLIKKGFLDV